ncbi:heme exporter protein CcmD [Pelagibius marinus]|uniref:heme exporter protein CcmD n=1 Tax=Pelagibius marinus TaxID=2762760 RepID=UPI001D050150|nr:heme exporter protein CcmD [Pelagibius marinus]
MEEITAFFEMGGYAVYVWPSLALTVVIMAGLLIATLRQLRNRQRRLAELEARGVQRQRRQRPAPDPTAQPGAETREARP